MSKFRIYRADSADPKLTGRQNKKLYMAYSFLFLLIMLTMNIHINSHDKKSSLVFYLLIGTLILITLWLVFEMKRQSRSLQKIGILEFTGTSVKKEIGDLTSSYPYDNILKIELERHLRTLTNYGSKTGSLTHILKIIYKDLKEENFIVSDRSMDFGQKISIIETLKTLKSLSRLDNLTINNQGQYGFI